jgi:hypothetical protein
MDWQGRMPERTGSGKSNSKKFTNMGGRDAINQKYKAVMAKVTTTVIKAFDMAYFSKVRPRLMGASEEQMKVRGCGDVSSGIVWLSVAAACVSPSQCPRQQLSKQLQPCINCFAQQSQSCTWLEASDGLQH